MNEKLEKAKAHLKKNKVAYIASGISFASGAILSAVVGVKVININDNLNVKLWSPTNNTIITQLVRRGHPGNLIKCLETGEVFASQNRAAGAMKLDPAAVSKHLKGVTPHVKGFHFEKLGEAV